MAAATICAAMASAVPRTGTPAARAILAVCLLACPVACSDDPVPIPSDARTVELAAFSETDALTRLGGARPEIVETPQRAFEPAGAGSFNSAPDEDSGIGVAVRPNAPGPRMGQRWPVESLVGQINGRPIYADEFFKPSEDHLMSLAAKPDGSGKQEAILVVRQRFRALVDTELIIAEAQSRLTPEMQQGVLAWLRDMQEQTVAQYGGSRADAERELMESEDRDLSGYMEDQKNRALVSDILRKKVDPRVIVSWRDIEQLYEQNRTQFAPEPISTLGRIVLQKDTQAEQIERVKKMFAEGKTFAEVATAINARDGGKWRQVRVTPQGLDLSELSSQELLNALRGLKLGQVSPPIEFRTRVEWLAVLDETRPETHTVFDPGLQIALRRELEGRRRGIEQARYIASLRSRWLTSEITDMEKRLLIMLNERYFDPIR